MDVEPLRQGKAVADTRAERGYQPGMVSERESAVDGVDVRER